jgi:hypothetical protein
VCVCVCVFSRGAHPAQGKANSRRYNETVITGVLASLLAMTQRPPVSFRDVLRAHMLRRVPPWLDRLDAIISEVRCHSSLCICVSVSKMIHNLRCCEHVHQPRLGAAVLITHQNPPKLEYPLLPVSQGFRLAVTSSVRSLRRAIEPHASPLFA